MPPKRVPDGKREMEVGPRPIRSPASLHGRRGPGEFRFLLRSDAASVESRCMKAALCYGDEDLLPE